MKKEDFTKLGIAEDLAEKAAQAFAEFIKDFIPKARFNEVNEAKKKAEETIAERDKQLEELRKSAGDNEDLRKQIETLQNENATTKQNHEAEIKKMKIDNALVNAIREAGGKNPTAISALIKDLDKAELLEDGTIKGLSEQLKTLKEKEAYLFEAEGGSFKGIKPGEGGKGGQGGITKEQFNKMSYKARVELYNSDPDTYRALAK